MVRKNIEKLFVGLAFIAIIVLFVCFFKDILVPLFSLEFGGNFDEAREHFALY